MKPAIVIFSSRQLVPVAEAVQENLRRDFEVTPWTQGFFRSNELSLNSFLKQLLCFDGAVVLLGADDLNLTDPGKTTTQAVPRDNVVFELGACMARFGTQKTFFICPEQPPVKLPTYFAGFYPLTYEQRSDANLVAATGAACARIREQFRQMDRDAYASDLPAQGLAVGYFNNFVSPAYRRLQAGGRLAGVGCPELSPGEFKNLSAFILKLQRNADEVSTYLSSRLSEATRNRVADYSAVDSDVKALATPLLENLNSIIQGQSIHEPQRFAAVNLSPETLTLLAQNPQGRTLARLNRLLLEDTYPAEIQRRPGDEWTGGAGWELNLVLPESAFLNRDEVEREFTKRRLVKCSLDLHDGRHISVYVQPRTAAPQPLRIYDIPTTLLTAQDMIDKVDRFWGGGHQSYRERLTQREIASFHRAIDEQLARGKLPTPPNAAPNALVTVIPFNRLDDELKRPL